MSFLSHLRQASVLCIVILGFAGRSAVASPTITTISPGSGPTSGGTTVTVTGTGFGAAPVLHLNTTSPVILSSSTTQLVFVTPEGNDTGSIIVINNDTSDPNVGTSNVKVFVYDSPVIDSLIPSSGPAAGGTTLTLSGSNFGTSPIVKIAGRTATLGAHTHTSITCASPLGSGTSQTLSLSVGTHGATYPSGFSYDPPSITSFSPASGPSSGGTTVTIVGKNFGPNPSVVLNSGACTIISSSDTTITCTTPSGAGALLAFTVDANGQTASSAATFSYDPPNITGLSVHQSPTEGGGTIAISGTSFGASGTATLGGIIITPTGAGWNHTQIVGIIPPGTGINKDVAVSRSGQTGTLSNSFSYDPPVITQVFPTHAAASSNALITIQGLNFGASGATIKFNGATAAIQNQNHHQIVCTLPPGSGSDASISVTVDGQVGTTTTAFSYDPIITSFSPSHGSTSGGTTMTIAGTGFGSTPQVTIGGTACTVMAAADTSITLVTPSGDGASVPLTVTAHGATVNSSSPFSYDPPTIAGISVNHDESIGGTTVTVNGTNFGLAATATLGGSAITIIPASRTHTSFIGTIPAGTGRNKSLIVTQNSSFGSQTSSPNFSFSYDPPTITGISPSHAPSGSHEVITLDGLSLGTSSGFVNFNGLILVPTSQQHRQMKFTLPDGQGSNLSVSAIVDTQASTNTVQFNYDPPVVTSITPNHGPTSGGTPVTISGSLFGASGTVQIGSGVGQINSYTTSTILCTTPAGQGTSQTVAVNSGGQTGSLVGGFSYDPPTITGISPVSGSTAGGFELSVSGTNFGTSPQITFDGGPITPTFQNHTLLKFMLPAGEGKNKNLLITVAGQGVTTNTFSYSAPIIFNATPTSSPTSGGLNMTISGQNFGLNPAVTIAGRSATLVSHNHTQIICTVPAGAGANQQLSVTAAAQTGTYATPFSYDPPTVAAVSPDYGTTAGGTLLTISGSNFSTPSVAPAQVAIGGAPASVVSQSETTITCTTPTGIGANKYVQITVAGQSNTTNTLFSYDPLTTSALNTSGNCPATSFDDTATTVDFTDGSGPGFGGDSETTVTKHRNAAANLSNLPGAVVADVYWQIESNRSFTDAFLAFQYTDIEINGLLESGITLYSAPTPAGPWTPVSNQSHNNNTNTLTGETSHFSYFALAGQPVPVQLSAFGVE